MWNIVTTDVFDQWYEDLNESQKVDVLASIFLLREKGPQLSRPYADTLYGARFTNMKELRIQHKGKPIRVFYAFDPSRTGVILCGGNKAGVEKLFYKKMLVIAEKAYAAHLANN